MNDYVSNEHKTLTEVLSFHKGRIYAKSLITRLTCCREWKL